MDIKKGSPRIIGLAGLVPFLILTVLSLIGPELWRDWVSVGLIAYGAVILSFLGGITFGMAVDEQQSDNPIYWFSVLPFLAAWAALLVPVFVGLCLLIVAFLGALVNDFLLKRAGLTPQWFFSLRVLLTSVVVLCLGAALFGV